MGAQAVMAHAAALVAAGIKPEHIGIITPYNAQVRWFVDISFGPSADQDVHLDRLGLSRATGILQVTLLRELRPRPALERLEISSVDGFQGACLRPSPLRFRFHFTTNRLPTG